MVINTNRLQVGDVVEVNPEVFQEYAEKPKLAKVEGITAHFRPGYKFVTMWGQYRNALKRYTLAVRDNAEFIPLANAEAIEKLNNAVWDFRVAGVGKEVLAALGYTVGSDPEIFVEDAKGNLIPAFKFLPGKTKPKVYNTQNTAQTLYWDGFQAEFTIYPQTCLAYMVDGLRAGLGAVLHEARKYDKGAKLSTATVVEIPSDFLKNAEPDEVALGCDPSFNIYKMAGQPVPDGRELPMRFAGGHVHLGNGSLKTRATDVIGAIDMLVGIPSVGIFEHWDSPVRRKYYGLPGEHRIPSYGVEYRVLSNAWLRHPALAHLTFDLCRLGSNFGFKGFHSLWKGNPADVPQIIVEGDVPAARKLIKTNENLFKNIIETKYAGLSAAGTGGNKGFDAALAVMMEGAHSFMKAPDDIEANWALTKGDWMMHSENKDAQWYKASRDISQGNKI